MSQLPGREWQVLLDDCVTYTHMLEGGQHYVGSHILDSVHTATTLRLREGKLHISDGPVAETKEQLAGYLLLEARDINQAIYLTSLMPTAHYGCVELRPVRDLTSPRQSHQGIHS